MPDQLREAMQEAGLDRRAAMEKAFDTLNTDAGEGGGGESTESVEKPVISGKDGGDSEPVIKPDGEENKGEAEKPAQGKREVKFQAKDKPKTEKSGAPAAKDGEQPKPTASKAPGSWKPEERELWNSVPDNVKAIIQRREQETSKALNDSAAARRWSQEFGGIIRPVEHLIRSSGVTPLQAVNNLVQTAATLHVGTPAQKAGLMATMIKNYGVDLQMLDAMLAGQPAPKGQNGAGDDVLRAIDQRLKPVNEFIQTVQGSRQAAEERLRQESQQTAEQFAADPANEFFNDLREDIADILDLAASRGREMTLKQAYDLAVSQHPEISQINKQRQEAAQTAERAKTLERSRRAASSQPAGTPGRIGGGNNKPKDRREALSQAWEDLSSR